MSQVTELVRNPRSFHNNMLLPLPDLRLESGSVDSYMIL